MEISITSRNLQVSEAMYSYAQKKLSKFDKFFGDNARAYITVSMGHGKFTFEVTIEHKGFVYRAQETTSDFNASVDGAVDSIVRQIHKNKTRLTKHLHENAFIRNEIGATSEFDADADEHEEHEEEEVFVIQRTKRFPIKPMDVQEAILQMNLLGHEFFMFRNMNDNEVNLVYKRKEGGYGLIEASIK